VAHSTITNNSSDQAGADLPELARKIRDGLHAVEKCMSNALDRALDVGNLLNAAQHQHHNHSGVRAAHLVSSWKSWLRDECSIAVSTACLYQQLARHREGIEAEMSRVPALTLRAARRLIAKPSSSSSSRSSSSTVPPAPPPKQSELTNKLTKALRSALSHVKSNNETDRASALASLTGIANLLAAKNLDLHDLVIGIQQKPARPRRSK